MQTILLVDDDRTTLIKISGILSKAGYQVISAENGVDAMKQFKQHAPDLVITDIYMPDQDGIETIMKLHELSAQTPVIAISGGGVAGDFLRMLEDFGLAGKLYKPINKDTLLNTVASVFSREEG